MEPFESVNVYPLLAHLLGIKPRPNNASLALFKHVLKDWIEEEGESSNLVLYASIFGAIGGMLLILMLVIGICIVKKKNAEAKSTPKEIDQKEQYRLVSQA